MRSASCLLLVSTLAAQAAGPLTWEKLLASSQGDPSLKSADKKISLLRQGPGTKYWDDMEFRYQADGLGMLEHDFELRVKPAPLGEKKAAQQYWKSQERYQEAKRRDDYSELLYDRYERALRYLAVKTRLDLRQQLVAVNQDRIQVLLALSGSDRFDPVALIEAQSKDADLRAEVFEDQDLLREITARMQSWVPGFDSVALDTAWLPKVEEIQATLTDHPPVVDSAYPELAEAARKLEAGQARIALENTGDQSIVQSVSVGYKWTIAKKEYDYVDNVLTDDLVRKEDNSRAIDRWSIGVGLRIPFFDSKGDDQVRRQVDLLDRESDYLAEKRDLEHKVSRIREEIGALLQQRSVQKQFVKQIDAGSLFQDFATRTGNDPLLLLKARESSLESDLRAVKLEYEIYYRYLVLLQYSGVLARENIVNHLSAGIQK